MVSRRGKGIQFPNSSSSMLVPTAKNLTSRRYRPRSSGVASRERHVRERSHMHPDDDAQQWAAKVSDTAPREQSCLRSPVSDTSSPRLRQCARMTPKDGRRRLSRHRLPEMYGDLGTRYVSAVAAQDEGALRACFAADVAFRALIPPGLRERTGAVETAALISQWFGDSTELHLLDSRSAEVGDRLHLSYRFAGVEDASSLLHDQRTQDPARGSSLFRLPPVRQHERIERRLGRCAGMSLDEPPSPAPSSSIHATRCSRGFMWGDTAVANANHDLTAYRHLPSPFPTRRRSSFGFGSA
jgi:hypothetical protein